MERVKAAIRDVPDFPKPGIVFKDITPVLARGDLLDAVVRAMAAPFKGRGVESVAAIESRGFLLGAPLARELGVGVVLLRKSGKLPAETLKVSYELEYGTDSLEIHADAVAPGTRVLIVDDVLATGGTAAAAVRLIEKTGARVEALAFMIELGFLRGRSRLQECEIVSLIAY